MALRPGLVTTCYNGAYRGLQASDSERIPKARQSGLSPQPDLHSRESLVIANQNVAVNTFLALYKTPPVTPVVGRVAPEVDFNLREGVYYGVIHDWGEVVLQP